MDGSQGHSWEVFRQDKRELPFLFKQIIFIPLHLVKAPLLGFCHMPSFEKVFCLGKKKSWKITKLFISIEVEGSVDESFWVEFSQ